MVETKPIEDVVSKWKGRAVVSEPDYRKGVTRAKDWQGKTLAAAERYATGVTTAIGEGRFGKGVGETTTEEWRTKTTAKAPRWSDGIAKSEADFRKGISEVLTTIAGVTLSERGPAGSPANYNRVMQIGDALHKMKTGK